MSLSIPINSYILPVRYQPITENVILGGFGSVQQVLDTFLGREVLFKSMQDKDNNSQLLNEIQGLSKARSRHVVEIYDVICDDHGSVIGIIIEMLNGRDYLKFHAEAKDNPLGYLLALYQIATGLSDLHAANVVHRDLKLDNLRESTSGILKLFDFGISVADLDYKTTNNRGTFVYAAPELFVQGTAITPEVDVYAFGACAWALASDTWPKELLERPPQTSARAPSIDSVMTGLLPHDVVDLIDSCLHPNPTQRPKSCNLRQRLARHIVRGHHKGIFVQGNNEIYELSNEKPIVKLKIGELGELKVEYDGLVFRIVEVFGSVFVNNHPAAAEMELHEACVLTFGAPNLGPRRQWVSFSSSHPEVIL
jgi:serine/threonine protein kinase